MGEYESDAGSPQFNSSVSVWRGNTTGDGIPGGGLPFEESKTIPSTPLPHRGRSFNIELTGRLLAHNPHGLASRRGFFALRAYLGFQDWPILPHGRTIALSPVH